MYSSSNDNWTVSNVLDERDMKYIYIEKCLNFLSKREPQRIDEGLLDTGGYEQVQLLKQQLIQRDEEVRGYSYSIIYYTCHIHIV